jgi:hypothetical protein
MFGLHDGPVPSFCQYAKLGEEMVEAARAYGRRSPMEVPESGVMTDAGPTPQSFHLF